jgi:hypothetical protein
MCQSDEGKLMRILTAAAARNFGRSAERPVRSKKPVRPELSGLLFQKSGEARHRGEMNKFRIKVARIERTGRGEQDGQVCVTFQLDRRLTGFQVPVLLSIKDFDDTEMVEAARNALHLIFSELASQSLKWKLTANDLKQLSSVSMRTKS